MAFDYRREYYRYKQYYLNLLKYYEKPVTKASTSLILTFSTIAFFVFFAIRPTVATISELLKEIGNKKDTAEKLTQKINTLAQAQEEYIATQDVGRLVDAALPNEAQVNQLVREVEYIVQQTNFNLTTLRFGDFKLYDVEEQGKGKGTVTLTLGGETNYGQVKTLIDELTNYARVVEVNNFSLSQKEDEEGFRYLNLFLDLESYYMGTEAAQIKEVGGKEVKKEPEFNE